MSQSFQSFLQNENIGKDALSIWALAKPCQIASLARIAVESTTGFDLLRSLARVPEFIKAVLELKPSLFDDLPDKTASSGMGGSLPDHLSDCAALVSYFTLERKTLPAFAAQLIKDAAASVTESPVEASFRPLCELFSAIPSNILEFFNEESLTALSARCKEVFSRFPNREKNIEMMLSQAIVAQVAVAFQEPQTPSKSSLDTPPGAKFSDACRKRVLRLFSDSIAANTLKVTILRSCLLCTEDSPSPALEGIRLAQTIITPISALIRQQFVEKNMNLIEKVLSRSARDRYGLKVRLEVSLGIQRYQFKSDSGILIGCTTLHVTPWC
jgi:hypothetical protein